MFNQYPHQLAGNPYYAQPGLLPQGSIVSPQQAAMMQHPSLGLLTPQQQLHHPGLIPGQSLLGQHAIAGHGQTASLLGSPPNRMHVNPMLGRAILNQALINNQLKPKIFNRGIPYKPIVKPKLVLPLKPAETISKLEKLIPEFEHASKFTANAKEFLDLFMRGINKETTTKFFDVLQKLSAFIGSPEYNSVAVWRVFDGAFTKRTVFSPEEVESITKWKSEVDAKIKPKPSEFGKRPAPETPSDSHKRAKVESNGIAPVEGILLKRIDTLEDELSKLRDEVTQTKLKLGKELAQIRLFVGVIPTVDEEDLPDAVSTNTETEGAGVAVVEETAATDAAPEEASTEAAAPGENDLNSTK